MDSTAGAGHELGRSNTSWPTRGTGLFKRGPNSTVGPVEGTKLDPWDPYEFTTLTITGVSTHRTVGYSTDEELQQRGGSRRARLRQQPSLLRSIEFVSMTIFRSGRVR